MNGHAAPQPAVGALHLFKDYVKHTLLIMGIYVILVLSTLLLDYCSRMTKDSPFHYYVLVALERTIFVAGSFLLLLMMLYITAVFIRDLAQSAKKQFGR